MNKKILYIYVLIFLVMSMLLGKVMNFYELVPYWDKILHLFSGFILFPWGIYFFSKLDGDNYNTKLKITFGLIFSFACALFWEVWEFSGDSIFGFNSQNNSLNDTMWDMIVGCVGSLISATVHR